MAKDVGNKEITNMTSQTITKIEQQMLAYLDNSQMKQLHAVLTACLQEPSTQPDINHVQLFLAAKRVEGCSEKTIRYYDSTLRNALDTINKDVLQITTDDLRLYLDSYQSNRAAGKTTIDNIRRILSSFFAWLEDEDYIMKSPVRRIHKVKTCKTVKDSRDLALIDLLASTGMRVGELVLLNRDDIDFTNRECVVLGKGNKQRKVYFDARAKIHLKNYLQSRTDDNPALFVSLQKPYNRLQIRGIEIRLHDLGEKLNLCRIHPHKFRRTLATMAIDKGMPIEQVQQLLGHQSVDTTLQYAMVNQANVKQSHKKYLG